MTKAKNRAVYIAAMVVTAGAVLTSIASIPTLAASPQPIGSSIEEMLEIVRRMNPELAALALEAEAAAARAEAADKLPDPKFAFRYDEWPRAGSDAPSLTREGVMKFEMTQELPLWGKLDLKREQAEAEHRQAQGQRQAATLELATRVKIVASERHQTRRAIDQLGEVASVVERLHRFAQSRYSQGLGVQLDVIQADLERRELETERVKMNTELRLARIRLNALLNRPADAPLVETSRLRAPPRAAALDVAALVERARQSNPDLHIQQAKIDAADKGRELADRSWYPDVSLGVGAIRKEGRFDSYETMVELNIPLQWGLRRAQQADTSAMASAARSRSALIDRKIEADLHEAYAGLQSAQEREKILREGIVPRLDMALQATVKAYELSLTDFTNVLEAERKLKNTRFEQLKLELEQQMRLAEIERLIGGDL
ncbi:outer membrane protein, heavy metal efflux system [Azospirillaceae bacterium]